MGDLMAKKAAAERYAQTLVSRHWERLLGDYMVMKRDHSDDLLQVTVPRHWPAEFDEGATLLGLPVVRGDVSQPEVDERG